MLSPLALALAVVAAPPDAVERGVALGLFASDPAWDYGPLLDEIAALGVKDVLLALVWTQRTVQSVEMHRQPGLSPDDATVLRTLRQARARGLRATLFPIVRPEAQSYGAWRGTLAPAAGVDAWFSSYESFISVMAALAEQGGAARLSVGTEYLSLEKHEAAWRRVIARARARFSGRVLYSANWDSFDAVPFWDAVDDVGVTAYFELAADERLPDDAALDAAWAGPRAALAALRARTRRPLIVTEVGYPSRVGAARAPWDEIKKTPVDLEGQAVLLRAFCRAFSGRGVVDGFYVWNWFGLGGPRDTGYTPRGKPAARAVADCAADFLP